MGKKIELEADKVEVKEKGGSFSSLMRGILLGGLIGAGWALLSAPRTGEETRAMLREKGMELRDLAAEKTEETRQKAEELTRQGANKALEARMKGEELLNQQKTTLESLVSGVKEGLRTYNEQGQAGEVGDSSQTF